MWAFVLQGMCDRLLQRKSSQISRCHDSLALPTIVSQAPHKMSSWSSSAKTEHLATCLFCGYDFCTECKRSYHGVQECPRVFEVSGSYI
ncbi:hypothetical protein COOONC_18490 [Cooperia oncophora]